MRIFAGPNGSGKSTVINKIRTHRSENRPIDFGFYVNADEIARILRDRAFSFSDFELETTKKAFQELALKSGLINERFPQDAFDDCFNLRANKLYLKNGTKVEHLAQVTADFLRKKLLEESKKFSFETVFSHESKLDIMRQAAAAGYKVYLYFVSTSSPEINKFRVEARVRKGGHYVDPQKIVDRYYRSMELLYDAAQVAYQAFFFDNSRDGEDASIMFAHFKRLGEEKRWDPINRKDVPTWFINYYSARIPRL